MKPATAAFSFAIAAFATTIETQRWMTTAEP